jgi:hypothetical protein
MALISSAADGRELRLDSAAGSPLRNWQAWELTRLEAKDCEDLERRFATSFQSRGDPTPAYNCHGLTFASRRTRIWDAATLGQILVEDRYAQVSATDVLPGDAIVYFGPKNDPEHSGVVVAKPTPESFGYPLVCSKWGNFREVLHYAHVCEYSLSDIRYFRVNYA